MLRKALLVPLIVLLALLASVPGAYAHGGPGADPGNPAVPHSRSSMSVNCCGLAAVGVFAP